MQIFQLPKQVPVASSRTYQSCKAFFYVSGTTTDAPVYQDAALTVPHQQPVQAASNGVLPVIYLDDAVSYRVRLVNASNALIYDVDPITAGAAAADTVLTTEELAAGLTADDIDPDYEPGDVRRYGADPRGVEDSTTALAAAISTGLPLDFGTGTYRITGALAATPTSDLTWTGKEATILYGGTHIAAAVSITTAAKIAITLSGLTFDGGNLCNIPLRVASTAAMASAATFVARNVTATRAKKNATFDYAAGVVVKGSFDLAEFDACFISECVMPAGTGESGVSGLSGINVTPDGTAKWTRRVIVSGTKIEKIYSSDLDYQFDQDGIGYFVPDDTSDAGKVDSLLVVEGNSYFVNCYGRSIKTQCRDTVVRDSKFLRTEGLSSGTGNTEIDSQTGSLALSSCTFDYRNGYQPVFCARVLGDAESGESGLTARDCTVYVDSTTTLGGFVQIVPGESYVSTVYIDGVRVYGNIVELLDYRCNGDQNYARVSNCWLNTIVDGEMSDKALVYLRADGSDTPRSAFVEIVGNYYYGSDTPGVARSQITGSEMTACVSARNNIGFSSVAADKINPAGLYTNSGTVLGRVVADGAQELKGYHEIFTKVIAADATATVPVRKEWGGAFILIVVGGAGNGDNYALFSSTNAVNTSIAKSASFVLGTTTNPGSGTFRVWSSADHEITIENKHSAEAPFTIFVLTVG